ncbi:PQQ-binding-like beta-propeller repeat protein [Fontisphaera persica]|uniref:outer membrane protein assembly factor BamB family protein n=1 Tax=Fontisphaera persica TaxID=2974023 RepID=UPI0024BF65FB|nr:PQQ-binding-like beta-propeller repeat protein [Fontisphaera persica]WCJ59371.1 PQQ-binding-like beta-propeller repeat protein [Fontisphaera persica]
MNITRFLLGLALALTLGNLSAENWPRFRGPNGQGISSETNLPLTWDATNHIRWKTPIAGEGWSSPIVWNDRVFVTAAREDGTQCHVICLDRDSGKVLWDVRVFEQRRLRKEGKNSYATPTPCTDGQQVYAVFNDGSIVALDFQGQVAWTNREVAFYSRHGLGASPIVHEGLLIMPYDGSQRVDEVGNWPNNSDFERTGWQIPWDKSFLVALDTKTGRRVWTARRGMSRIAHVTPFIWRDNGREELISCAGDCIQGFDLKTGERLWTVFSRGEGVTPSPVYGEGLIFTSSGFEATTIRTVKPGGRGDVTATHIAWEQKRGAPTQSSLLYVKPHLYAVTDNGMLTCYTAANGEVVYQERLQGAFSASPVYADGRIYLLNEAGETIVIAPGPQFKVLARNRLNEKAQASIAVSQGRLFLRTAQHVYCIGP